MERLGDALRFPPGHRGSGHARAPLAILAVAVVAGSLGLAPFTRAACPAEPRLQHFTAGGTTPCTCFIPGEEAGAVFAAPAGHYPIEILKVGVAWGSMFGGNPSSLEQALHVYSGGLPDPGSPVFTLPGPTLHDGMTNVFDLEPLPGRILVHGGPFSVTVEFLNQSSGNMFASSVLYDADGCQPGKNAVFVVPGGWSDACPLGVPGDWVLHAEYRRANCGTAGRLLADPVTGGNMNLKWTASCLSAQDDYEVYEGTLGSFYSHTAKLCTTSRATSASFSPGAGDTYYLVVPTDGVDEGSYGADSAGTQRPQGTVSCAAQSLCP